MDHCSNGIDLDTPVSGHMRDPPHNRADLHTTEHCASHNLAEMLGRLPWGCINVMMPTHQYGANCMIALVSVK